MRVEDVPQANEIDRECFPNQWPTPSYRPELLFNRLSHYFVAWDTAESPSHCPAGEPEQRAVPSKASRLGQLVEGVRRFFYGEGATSPASEQRIVGLAGLWIIADEAHLTTIGVREAYRRQGIGELLLIAAIDYALMCNAQVVSLEVRASNQAAQALYEKYGLTKVGLRRGYYTDNREDAVVMSTDRIASASFQSQFQRLKGAHTQRWGPAECQIC